jgi:DNA (cytosine-5)-methyltransferase 1
MQSGIAYRLPPLVPRISGIGFFILAYSNGRDGGDEPDNIGENGSRRISDNIRSSGIDSADVADAAQLFSDGGKDYARGDGGTPAARVIQLGKRSCQTDSRSDWWASEPDVGRVADGVPARVDRLRGLGNAVVPQVAEFIGNAIIEHELRQSP